MLVIIGDTFVLLIDGCVNLDFPVVLSYGSRMFGFIATFRKVVFASVLLTNMIQMPLYCFIASASFHLLPTSAIGSRNKTLENCYSTFQD